MPPAVAHAPIGDEDAGLLAQGLDLVQCSGALIEPPRNDVRTVRGSGETCLGNSTMSNRSRSPEAYPRVEERELAAVAGGELGDGDSGSDGLPVDAIRCPPGRRGPRSSPGGTPGRPCRRSTAPSGSGRTALCPHSMWRSIETLIRSGGTPLDMSDWTEACIIRSGPTTKAVIREQSHDIMSKRVVTTPTGPSTSGPGRSTVTATSMDYRPTRQRGRHGRAGPPACGSRSTANRLEAVAVGQRAPRPGRAAAKDRTPPATTTACLPYASSIARRCRAAADADLWRPDAGSPARWTLARRRGSSGRFHSSGYREIEIGTAGKAGRATITNWPAGPRKAGSRSVSDSVVVSSVSSLTDASRASE